MLENGCFRSGRNQGLVLIFAAAAARAAAIASPLILLLVHLHELPSESPLSRVLLPLATLILLVGSLASLLFSPSRHHGLLSISPR